MNSGIRKAGLVALVGSIIGVGVYGCKKEEPQKEDVSATESVEQIEPKPAREDTLPKATVSLEDKTLIQGISYSDFPPQLQDILDERIAKLQTDGGICIAGKVKFSDGAPISGEDIMVNLEAAGPVGVVDDSLRVYEGGWFIMIRNLSSHYAGPDKGFVLRSFGYEPVDSSITVLDGEMTYLQFEIGKTPPEKLASVTGVVTNDHDRPVEGARVSISFPFSGSPPHMKTQTGPNGEYSFDGLSIAEHYVVASKSGYAYHSARFTPPEGGVAVEDLKLYPKGRTIIDYVYQADGSRDFTSGDIQTGTIDWLVGEGGVDFSEGEVEGWESGDLRDLELRQEQGVLKFRVFYVKPGRNGFYDAGAVPFDSVTEAAETGYATGEKPCKVGHVYVVRTYEEDNYAKFIVKSPKTF